MPTAPYYVGKQRVPGVTTILGRFKLARPLMYWAFAAGKEGKWDRLDDVTVDALDAGTIAHQLIEDTILHGRDLDPWEASPEALAEKYKATPEVADAALQSYDNYKLWSEAYSVTMVATEEHLVSEKHHFGGTPDAVGSVKGRLRLLDWKTSKGVYSDMILQLAAYDILWDENHPDEPVTGADLLRFDKETGAFTHHGFTKDTLEPARRMFLRLVECYALDKQVAKLAR